jgi:hypothetical protein
MAAPAYNSRQFKAALSQHPGVPNACGLAPWPHLNSQRITMEKEYIDRAKAIRQGILQLRDSL